MKGVGPKMTPFGFTPPNGPNGPDDGSQDGSGDFQGPEDFNEMLRAIQEQMREQFEKLGIPMENMDQMQFMSPENLTAMLSSMPGMASFGLGPQGAGSDPLPLATVRETAKKFVTAHGVAPLSTRCLLYTSDAADD